MSNIKDRLKEKLNESANGSIAQIKLSDGTVVRTYMVPNSGRINLEIVDSDRLEAFTVCNVRKNRPIVAELINAISEVMQKTDRELER